MHYSTERIINAVYNNYAGCGIYNDDIQILFGTTNGFEKPPWQSEPCSMEDFQVTVPTTDVVHSFPEYLDPIFEDESQLILETYEGADDDGGPCYQAFILVEDWVSHFWQEYNQQAAVQQVFLNLFIFNYISKNPEAFMIIWAGPY